MRNNKTGKNICELFEGFGLHKTSSSILATIAQGRKLFISEIAQRVKKSERAVRNHLSALLKKGFLNRKIEITKHKKLAYRYSLKPISKIAKKLKREFIIKIRKLDKFVRKM